MSSLLRTVTKKSSVFHVKKREKGDNKLSDATGWGEQLAHGSDISIVFINFVISQIR